MLGLYVSASQLLDHFRTYGTNDLQHIFHLAYRAASRVIPGFGSIAHQFTQIQPLIPTYLSLIGCAVVPIYAASHASLSRPASAAKPRPKKGRKHDSQETSSQRMEGLSPSDAIWYPVMTGSLLISLYYLIQWLKDPDILNKIINGYLAIFGIFSTAKLISDTLSVLVSFMFPSRFADGAQIWEVDSEKETVVAPHAPESSLGKPETRNVPLPGVLSRLPLPAVALKALWQLRRILTRSWLQIEIFAKGLFEADLQVGSNGMLGLGVSIAGLLYFNFVSKPWWLTNLFGFSFSYSALQLMSPTTFWTGTLVLTSLFFYDIYFVFFTPMMMTVATKLDVPVKLLIPKPGVKDPTKMELAMLGLGDIVLPGMMIGLALRFDLYKFYLNKQKRRAPSKSRKDGDSEDLSLGADTANDTSNPQFPLAYDATGLGKAEYVKATGSWGERFWLGNKLGDTGSVEGGKFPKPYFYASVTGYVLGMMCTVCVGQIYKHGQPALLYLVPSVLLSLWGTAWRRGEIQTMWDFTENEPGEDKGKESKTAKDSSKNGTRGTASETSGEQESNNTKSVQETGKPVPSNDDSKLQDSKEGDSATAKATLTTEQLAERNWAYFYFAVRRPRDPEAETITIQLNDDIVDFNAAYKGSVSQKSDAETVANGA